MATRKPTTPAPNGHDPLALVNDAEAAQYTDTGARKPDHLFFDRPFIWSDRWAKVDPSEVDGNGPLPSVQIVSRSNRGKSFTAASIPGKAIVFDSEESWSTLRYQRPETTHINLRELAMGYDKQQMLYNVFLAYIDRVMQIRKGEYDLIILDTYSDLHFGAWFWVKDNAHVFGKTAQHYGGKDGTIFQWADSTAWWENHLTYLTSLCQTVVLLTHPKDEYDKGTKERTGRQTARGADITNKVALQIWLFDNRDIGPNGEKPGQHNIRWGMVTKQRLSYLVKQPNGFSRTIDFLPRKLILEEGMSVAELIWTYLDKEPPQTGHGDLNTIVGDPTDGTTDEERAAAELHREELRREDELKQAKIQMFGRLRKDGLIGTQEELVHLLIDLGLTEDVQHAEKLLSVEAAIRKHLASENADE